MPELPENLQTLLDEVQHCWAEAEPRHDHHRKRWERFYGLYRAYRDMKRSYGLARSPRDVDEVLQGARTGFGADLFIPYCFSVIETTLPRMLASNPRLGVAPDDPGSEDNTDNVKLMIERQQNRVDYQLTLQTVGKSGLMYGLGVQKLPWARETRKTPVLERPNVQISGGPEWVISKEPVEKVLYEGPRPEAVDIFDWLWDPHGYDMRSLDYAFHRTWRSDRYVRDMFESKTWELPEGWDLEDVLTGAGKAKYEEVWSGRDAASGAPSAVEKGKGIHEVWEFHDGEKVVTVVNRCCVVQHGPNPYWHGELPFQIFRPTEIIHELNGYGEIEAIEDLQEEMNAMRSQRRDNATLVLQRPFAYFDGLVDPGDIHFAAGMMTPVDGNPRDLLYPIELKDIPFSSYKEEENLQRDIERTSGVDDTLAGAEGGGGASSTATGVQMVQAAANLRIALKTKRLSLEVVKPACRQWLGLNQQKIVTSTEIPGPPKPGEGDRQWSWYPIGPAELAGTFAVEPIDESMAPENKIARREEALGLLETFRGDPNVDQRKLAEHVLERLDIVDRPAQLMAPEEPDVPVQAIDLVRDTLAETGLVDPLQFEELVAEAVAQVQAAQQGTEAPAPEPAPQEPVAA
jgi:hypothetical protein